MTACVPAPPAPPDTASLSAQAGAALRWNTATTLARMLLQLGAQVLLARLLGPAAYGVYALGLALLTFANFIAGAGFSHGLVLRAEVDDADVRLAFTWQLVAGAACALAMLLAAPALAGVFHMPALAPTLRWMALACLITAASGTALCLLQRALDFRRLGLVQLAAYAAGYLGAGLPLALAGWEAQALAVACAVQAGTTLALAWWVRPHAARPLWRVAPAADDDAARREVFATGRRVFVTNLVNWLLANVDRLVVGRWLQAQAVGLYSLAWNLAQIPATLLVGAAQPAFLASGARLAGDRSRLARAWLPALAGSVVLLPPAAVTLALLAGDLVQLLYGPAWAGSAPLLALMLLGLPAWTAWALSTPLLWHTGQAWRESTLQLPLLAAAVAAWFLVAPRGAMAVAAVSLVLVHARAAVTVAAGLHTLGLRGLPLAGLLARGACLATACGLAAWAGLSVVPADMMSAPQATAAARLACGAAAATTCGLGLALAFPALLGPEARDLLRRVLPPALVRRLPGTLLHLAEGRS